MITDLRLADTRSASHDNIGRFHHEASCCITHPITPLPDSIILSFWIAKITIGFFNQFLLLRKNINRHFFEKQDLLFQENPMPPCANGQLFPLLTQKKYNRNDCSVCVNSALRGIKVRVLSRAPIRILCYFISNVELRVLCLYLLKYTCRDS